MSTTKDILNLGWQVFKFSAIFLFALKVIQHIDEPVKVTVNYPQTIVITQTVEKVVYQNWPMDMVVTNTLPMYYPPGTFTHDEIIK